MNIIKFSVLTLVSVAILSSCKKEQEESTNISKQMTVGYTLSTDSLGVLSTKEVNNIFVHQYHGTDGAQVNSYAIETKSKVVILDALHFKTRGQEMRSFANFLEKNIERVIVSHSHADHYMALGNFSDLPTYASNACITNITNEGEATRLFRISLGQPFASEYPDSVTIPKNIIEASFTVDGLEYQTVNFTDTEAKDQMITKIPSLKMVHCADLVTVNSHQILIDADQIIKAIQYLKDLGNQQGYTTLLTGHNGMEKMSVLDASLQYLKTAKEILDTNPTSASYQTQIEAAYPSYGDASFVVSLMVQAGVFV